MVEIENDGVRISSHPLAGGFSLSVDLDHSQALSLNVYDGLGREVYTSSNRPDVGRRDVIVPAASWPGGVYYYVLRGDRWSRSGKVLNQRQ